MMRNFVRPRQSSENNALETLVLVGLCCLALFSIGCAGAIGSKPNPPSGGPSVSLTSPANGATVSGVVTITASATDSVGIASVQFLVDGANLGSKVTASPYSVSWNTAQTSNGSHTLAAQAVNTAGKTATSSNVNVTV